MKKRVVLMCLVALALSANAATHIVGTYNIRIATKRDVGSKNWEVRKPYVARTITDNRMDILSLNEIGGSKQENDLRTLLPDYTLVAFGRDSAAASHGERVGVLFRTDKYDLLDSGHFFLTEQPDQPGLAWDAAYKRVAVWVLLRNKHSAEEMLIMSTHLDYKGTEARRQGAMLCIARAKEIASGRTAVIMGDLNAEPYETDVHSLFENANDAVVGSYGRACNCNIEALQRVGRNFTNIAGNINGRHLICLVGRNESESIVSICATAI